MLFGCTGPCVCFPRAGVRHEILLRSLQEPDMVQAAYLREGYCFSTSSIFSLLARLCASWYSSYIHVLYAVYITAADQDISSFPLHGVGFSTDEDGSKSLSTARFARFDEYRNQNAYFGLRRGPRVSRGGLLRFCGARVNISANLQLQLNPIH